MKNISIIFMIFSLLFAINCSKIKVKYDYDKRENFPQLQTYQIMPVPAFLKVNKVVREKIETAVIQQLSSKGYKKKLEEPSMLVVIHTYVQGRLNISDWGYSYADRNSYWQGSGLWNIGNIDAYTYEGGTLIIDFVNSKEKKLIWRGLAQGVLPENLESAKMDKLINSAVKKILKRFPSNE